MLIFVDINRLGVKEEEEAEKKNYSTKYNPHPEHLIQYEYFNRNNRNLTNPCNEFLKYQK